MAKPNCYDCDYRGKVAGSTHSSCSYGGNQIKALDLFSSKNCENAQILDIQAKQYGVQNGWFMWPIDFDPVWLTNCEGFIHK